MFVVASKDIFKTESINVKGLQVYEEHKKQTTRHWITEFPIKKCKGLVFDKTMLCCGSAVGTREAMLKYLEIMYEEMKVWIEEPKCRNDINGDDQSIHSYHIFFILDNCRSQRRWQTELVVLSTRWVWREPSLSNGTGPTGWSGAPHKVTPC
jgi:hypothetical protein